MTEATVEIFNAAGWPGWWFAEPAYSCLIQITLISPGKIEER